MIFLPTVYEKVASTRDLDVDDMRDVDDFFLRMRCSAFVFAAEFLGGTWTHAWKRLQQRFNAAFTPSIQSIESDTGYQWRMAVRVTMYHSVQLIFGMCNVDHRTEQVEDEFEAYHPFAKKLSFAKMSFDI